jgi:hypothetical protein
MFDMSKCKIGDKLITRAGAIGYYLGFKINNLTSEMYPYGVRIADDNYNYAYTIRGSYLNEDRENCRDIMGFYVEKVSKPKRVRKAKPINKLLGLCEWLSSLDNCRTCVKNRFIIGTIRNGSKKIGFSYYPYYMGGARAYVYIGYSRDRVCHGVTTLSNFKSAVTKLLKGSK